MFSKCGEYVFKVSNMLVNLCTFDYHVVNIVLNIFSNQINKYHINEPLTCYPYVLQSEWHDPMTIYGQLNH